MENKQVNLDSLEFPIRIWLEKNSPDELQIWMKKTKAQVKNTVKEIKKIDKTISKLVSNSVDSESSALLSELQEQKNKYKKSLDRVQPVIRAVEAKLELLGFETGKTSSSASSSEGEEEIGQEIEVAEFSQKNVKTSLKEEIQSGEEKGEIQDSVPHSGAATSSQALLDRQAVATKEPSSSRGSFSKIGLIGLNTPQRFKEWKELQEKIEKEKQEGEFDEARLQAQIVQTQPFQREWSLELWVPKLSDQWSIFSAHGHVGLVLEKDSSRGFLLGARVNIENPFFLFTPKKIQKISNTRGSRVGFDLRHKNLGLVFDSGQADGTPYTRVQVQKTFQIPQLAYCESRVSATVGVCCSHSPKHAVSNIFSTKCLSLLKDSVYLGVGPEIDTVVSPGIQARVALQGVSAFSQTKRDTASAGIETGETTQIQNFSETSPAELNHIQDVSEQDNVLSASFVSTTCAALQQDSSGKVISYVAAPEHSSSCLITPCALRDRIPNISLTGILMIAALGVGLKFSTSKGFHARSAPHESEHTVGWSNLSWFFVDPFEIPCH